MGTARDYSPGLRDALADRLRALRPGFEAYANYVCPGNEDFRASFAQLVHEIDDALAALAEGRTALVRREELAHALWQTADPRHDQVADLETYYRVPYSEYAGSRYAVYPDGSYEEVA
jgi:hypothetical protein